MEEISKKNTGKVKLVDISAKKLLREKVKAFEKEQIKKQKEALGIYYHYYKKVFKKLTEFTELTQKKYLPKITYYRGKELYFNQRFPEGQEQKLTKEEKKNLLMGKFTIEREKESRIAVDRFKYRKTYNYTRVKKFHVVKGEFDLEDDIVMARAIGFYLTCMSHMDDFFDQDKNQFYSKMAPEAFSEWSEFQRDNIEEVINFNFGVMKENAPDYNWKCYFNQEMASTVMRYLRNNFDDPKVKTSIEYHSIISRSIIDFFINLILMKNCIVTPKAAFLEGEKLKRSNGEALFEPIVYDALKFRRGVVYGTTYADIIKPKDKKNLNDTYSFCCKFFSFLNYDKRKRSEIQSGPKLALIQPREVLMFHSFTKAGVVGISDIKRELCNIDLSNLELISIKTNMSQYIVDNCVEKEVSVEDLLQSFGRDDLKKENFKRFNFPSIYEKLTIERFQKFDEYNLRVKYFFKIRPLGDLTMTVVKRGLLLADYITDDIKKRLEIHKNQQKYRRIEKDEREEEIEARNWKKFCLDLGVLGVEKLVKDYSDLEKERRANFVKKIEAKERDHYVEKVKRFSPKLPSILKILKKIPNFKLKFSKKQKSMLTDDSKVVLTIGRSGTGKTTCAILRMIAIDLLYIASEKIKKGERQITSEDIKATGVRSVFITANEILSRELQQFHNRIMEALRKKFKKKEEKDNIKEVLETAQNLLNEEDETNNVNFSGNNEDKTQFDNKTISKMKKGTLAELEELVQNVNFGKEDYKIPSNMKFLKDSDFPLFCTLKEFYVMLNNGITHNTDDVSFFNLKKFKTKDVESLSYDLLYRDYKLTKKKAKKLAKKLNIEVSKEKSKLRDEYSGEEFNKNFSKFLDEYSSSRFKDELEFDKIHMNYKETEKRSKISRKFYYSKLITFEIFKNEFYEKKYSAKQAKKFPASLVWSYLKNKNVKSSNRLYDFKEFGSFSTLESQYLEFKTTNHFYDLKDLFTHTKEKLDKKYNENLKRYRSLYGNRNKEKNKEREFFKYSKNYWYEQIDYLFVDEIQDISYEILIHLCFLTRRNLMLFGDNAQNIAKGISLKFQDLAIKLKEREYDNLYIQLTRNYRSHQNILNLGNSIVRILTLFSRGDLEVMPDEISERDGPKPMFISLKNSPEILKEALVKALDASEEEKTGALKFKNEFVVLVRNQETKNSLPLFLKNAVCMTIKESKGLEFDDVLIYDYFESSKSYMTWSVMESVEIVERKIKNKDLHEMLDLMNKGKVNMDRVYVKARDSNETGYSIVTEIVLSDHISKSNLGLYDEINDELKQFYVAVTRTKNRLIVYDKTERSGATNHIRSGIEKFWKDLGFIEVVNKGISKWIVEESKWSKIGMMEKEEGMVEIIEKEKDVLTKMIEYNKEETEEEFRAKWLKKAVEFFRQGKLKFARLCFSSISHEFGIEFVEACELIGNIQRRKEFMLQNLTKMTENHIDEQEQFIKSDFLKAANIFKKQGRSSLAAKCFSSVGDYEQALDLAMKSNDNEMKADLCFINKNYQEAYKYYELSDNLDMQVRTLNEICKTQPDYYEKLLNLMYELTSDMTEEDHEAFKPFFKSVIKNYFSHLDQAMKEKEIEQLKIEMKKENEAKEEEKEEIVENEPESKIENEVQEDQSGMDSSSFVEIDSFEGSSFKMIGSDDNLSASDNSFYMVQSDLNEAEKMSESFINKGSLVKGNTDTNSIFEEVETFDASSFNFLESSTIAKMIKYTSCFFDKIKGYMHMNKIKSGMEISEEDELLLIQDTELIKILLEILADLNLTNLLSLLFNKYKVKYPIESSLINLVKGYSMVWNFKLDYKSQLIFSKTRIVNSLTQRKISAMIIKSTFNKLKIGATNKDIGLSALMALGFIRQIPALTNHSTAKKIFSLLGNTEFIFPLIGYKKFKGKELDAFLIKNSRSNLIEKLLLIFDCLEEDIEAIDAVLYKYSVFELWEKCGKKARNKKNEILEKISVHNKLLARTIKVTDMIKYFHVLSDEEKKELAILVHKIFNKINRTLEEIMTSSPSELLIAGYSVAILSRFLFFSSYTLNTQENYSFIKNYYEKSKKKMINFLFTESPALFKQLVKLQNFLKVVDFSSKSTIMNKNHYLFLRGYLTAYLARILDPSVKEFRFYSNKRIFLNKFSILTKTIEEKKFAIENGGEFLLYSFNELIKHVKTLRDDMYLKLMKWSKKSVLIQSFSNVSGLLGLCKISDLTDDHVRILGDYKNDLGKVKLKIKPEALAESVFDHEEARMLNKNREKLVRKLKSIKLENYLKKTDENVSNLLVGFEDCKEEASKYPYFQQDILDSKREGILNIFKYIEKFIGLASVQTIYEHFCLSLNMGNLGYFLKFRRQMNIKRKKKFKTPLFYLIDSEISLQTGNTEEFYNEILEFILNQFENLNMESICHLFYKVIMIVSLQHGAYSNGKEVTLIEGDYKKLNYYSHCNADDLRLNKIEKDKNYDLLQDVFELIMEKNENFYFPETEQILNKIEFLIQENGLFEIEEEIDFKFENKIKLKLNTENYSLDENYGKYDSLLKKTQIQRANLEFVAQTLRKFIASRTPVEPKEEQETAKDLTKFQENLTLIDYDYILWLDGLNNPQTLKLFQEESFCKLFKLRLKPFIIDIYEEFYENKKKSIEKFLPFVINFNNELMDLISGDSDDIGKKVMNLYKFVSIKRYKMKSILKEKNEVKIFKTENEFFESQKILMRKMLLGFKITQDLNKTKKLIQKEKKKLVKKKKEDMIVGNK